MNTKRASVVKQDEALSAYFEALLNDEPMMQPQTEEPMIDALPEPIIELPVIAPPMVVPLDVPDEVEQTVEQPALAGTDGMPDWAEHEFQALLFTTSGLTLAVPLSELSGIQVWHGEKVTPMPGHVDWYLGLMQYRERSVPVIDTAQLVLPEERLACLSGEPGERIQRIVFIGGGQWGLACDSVDQVITLSHEQVKWRSSRTKRRWLAGTVIEHMCAIIDPPAFAEMLATGMEDSPSERDDDARDGITE
jgi:purine-binding chemotaxis protein CheW